MRTIEEKLIEVKQLENVFCVFMQTTVFCKTMGKEFLYGKDEEINLRKLNEEIDFLAKEIMYCSCGNTGDIFPNASLYFDATLYELKEMYVNSVLDKDEVKANEHLDGIKTILLIINMINEWNCVSNGTADEWIIPEYCL